MCAEPLTSTRYTPAEYLVFERASPERHEYLHGEIYGMSGASLNHNRVAGNVLTELKLQMRGRPCEAFSNDMRVAVDREGPFFYPDVVALCGKPELLDDERDTLINPQVVIEVLSRSTRSYDRGNKFMEYRRLASLREYLLVSPTEVRVEHHVRQADGRWLLSDHLRLDEVLELPTLGCHLALTAIYDKVELAAAQA